MKETPIDPSYIDKLKLPGFSPVVEKIEKMREEDKQKIAIIRKLKTMYPEAKNFCFICKTPIFDGGDCPNCS